MAVAFPGPDQPEVADDRMLEYEGFLALRGEEGLCLFGRRRDENIAVGVVAPGQPTIGYLGTNSRRGIESRDPGAARPQPLRQRALRGELNLEFACQILPRELLVLSDIRGRPSAGSGRLSSSRPSPQPSTPQLFETTSRSSTPASSRAAINTLGIPLNPKPPTASEDPDTMSATASRALATTLSTTSP